jgi:predicted esterase
MGNGASAMSARAIWGIILVVLAITHATADDFFDVNHLRFVKEQQDGAVAVFKQVEQVDPNTNQKQTVQVFEPFIEARVSVKDNVKSSAVMGKAYFYDSTKNLIATVAKPDVADHGNNQIYDWPVILSKDSDQFLYFAVPDKVLQQPGWGVVVVFGDAKGVDVQLYTLQDGSLDDYTFPEKNLVEDKNGPPIERKAAMDPIIEHVVETEDYNQPTITLFLRPPLGMTDASQAKGVLAMCLLADDVNGVRRQLEGMEAADDLSGPLRFAEDHKLIVLCWGSHRLWDPQKNWDDQTADATWAGDKEFDQVTKAWESGVQYFVKQYGIPQNNYLLWGFSGAAQYACRLALRRPQYFLAVHVHIPSSFDKPTPEGNHVLWCLTTGELEAGHERSLRFYKQCRALGYPMIYKAIPGLGHDHSPIADSIGLKFFEYALSVADQRTAYEKSLNDPLAQFQNSQTSDDSVQPWLSSFRQPAFVGDILNQEVFPYSRADMVLPDLRTPLPSKDIADAWNQNP